LVEVFVEVGSDLGGVAVLQEDGDEPAVAGWVVGQGVVVGGADDDASAWQGRGVPAIGQAHGSVVGPGQEAFQGLQFRACGTCHLCCFDEDPALKGPCAFVGVCG